MPDDKTPIVGSSLTSSSGQFPKVRTHDVNTDAITMEGVTAKGIAHDPEDPDLSKLVNLQAHAASLHKFEDIRDYVQYLTSLYPSTVITDPLINQNFNDVNWKITGDVTIDQGRAHLSEVGASLRVANAVFTNPGIYFIQLNVDVLPPGATLRVTNEVNDTLMFINIPGIHRVRYIIERPSVASIVLTVESLTGNTPITLTEFYLHRVRPSLDRYLDYLATDGSGSGFVNMDQLSAAMASTLAVAEQAIDESAALLNALIRAHTELLSGNPHNVRWNETGAAALVHTHIPSECGAAPVSHTHTADEVDMGGGISMGAITAHVENTNGNPHGVSRAMLQVDNLPNATTDLATLNRSDVLATAAAVYNARLELITHVSAANPHSISKSTIGLGMVEDYPPATLQETIDGNLEEANVCPKYLKQAVNTWASSTIDISKMQPVFVATGVVGGGQDFVINLQPGKKYQFYFTGESAVMQHVKWKYTFDPAQYVPANANYFSSYRGYTTGQQQKISSLMSLTYSDTESYNWGQATLDLDTTVYIARTSFLAYTVNVDGALPTYDDGEIVASQGLVEIRGSHGLAFGNIETDTIPDGTPATIQIQGSADGLVNVRVFELVNLYQQPELIVDATPVGSMMYTSIYTPEDNPGWCPIDGSTLSRATYDTLYNKALSSGQMKTEAEWEALDTAGEDVPFYSDGDGSTTFRIPKKRNLTNPWEVNIIKIHPVSIPHSTQALFNLIQS